MESRIHVERYPAGDAFVTLTDRNGMIATEYLTAAEVDELVSKLRGTWTPDAPTVTPFVYEQATGKDFGANNTTNTGEDGLLPALS